MVERNGRGGPSVGRKTGARGEYHMSPETIQILISMTVYMAAVVVIGLAFARRANQSSEQFFIGGRTLGPWVAAMSAEASDMSGWLLMGLPGVAYWVGVSDAAWTAIGLAIGTYLNWRIVARPLRHYSQRAGNAITIPDFFSQRFHEKRPLIMTIASLIILIFFSVYAGSCFVACGKLFSTLFNADYRLMVILGAVFVLFYTFIGGFLAESASDFMQGIVMVIALTVVVVSATAAAGGIGQVIENGRRIPGFFDFFGIAQPQLDEAGRQLAEGGQPLFGAAAPYGFLTILSTLSWGLGYFGMPQVLLRFIAIRRASELVRSRRIAMTWVVISLAFAVAIGLIGRALYPVALTTAPQAENIFILLSQTLMHPLIAGLIMSGILAATISSSDSYLLIAASAFAKNLYQGLMHREASDRQVMRVTRITLLAITVIGVAIAMDEHSVIFRVVSFAWAGFGATFGPLMLFSLLWKRTSRAGAIAGMLAGSGTVFVWKLLLSPLGGIFGLYELGPAFLVSSLAIVVVSLLSAPPSEAIQAEFMAVRRELAEGDA